MDEEQIEALAKHAEWLADHHLELALQWAKRSGVQSATDDLIRAGGLYRARDVLREKLG